MEIVLKTLLYSYPSLDIVVDGLEKLAEYKAITSFSNCHKTLQQMENIIKINDQMARVKELHSLTEGILNKLSLKERMLVEYKFFKYELPEGFDHNSRAYFREQTKTFNKLLKIMKNKNYDEEWFKDNYFDIYVLRNKFQKLKAVKAKNIMQNSASERWA
jgi:hypothetical protein